jgi:hypothetical protein
MAGRGRTNKIEVSWNFTDEQAIYTFVSLALSFVFFVVKFFFKPRRTQRKNNAFSTVLLLSVSGLFQVHQGK